MFSKTKTVTFENVCRVKTKRQVIIKMCKFNMFITAVSVLFLTKRFLTVFKTMIISTEWKKFSYNPLKKAGASVASFIIS